MQRIIISKQLERADSQDKIPLTDVNGDLQFEDAATIVTDNETVTSITDNSDGSFTYTNEAGTTTDFDNLPKVEFLTLVPWATTITTGIVDNFIVIHSALNGMTLDSVYTRGGAIGGSATISVRKNGVSVATGALGASIAVGEVLTTGDVYSFEITVADGVADGASAALYFTS